MHPSGWQVCDMASFEKHCEHTGCRPRIAVVSNDSRAGHWGTQHANGRVAVQQCANGLPVVAVCHSVRLLSSYSPCNVRIQGLCLATAACPQNSLVMSPSHAKSCGGDGGSGSGATQLLTTVHCVVSLLVRSLATQRCSQQASGSLCAAHTRPTTASASLAARSPTHMACCAALQQRPGWALHRASLPPTAATAATARRQAVCVAMLLQQE